MNREELIAKVEIKLNSQYKQKIPVVHFIAVRRSPELYFHPPVLLP